MPGNASISSPCTTSSDIAIVGAGPIGLELAVALKCAGLDYAHFDARQIGYTISWWPRNTYFFSTTERIEIAGVPAHTTTQQRLTGEEYLAYLRGIVEQFDLAVRTYEPVARIERSQPGFTLHTTPLTGPATHTCRKLVLAIGDMHRPTLLGVPGEDLPHVSHYFSDPHLYFRKRLLIVGGRNSAAEAALRCWRAGARVTLSYRRAVFDPKSVKHWILPDLQAQIEAGTIDFLSETLVKEIRPGLVLLERCRLRDARGGRVEDGEPASPVEFAPTGEVVKAPADFVLLLTGFQADQSLFEQAGVSLLGQSRTPQFNPVTMETNVPGLFVAGTAAAGSQRRYTLFIENTHVHVGRIVQALTGRWPERLGTVAGRSYELPFEDIQAN
jgi:thioredoxin reductase (NADPH)